MVGVTSAIGFWEFYRHFDLETTKEIKKKYSKKTKSTLDKSVPPSTEESGTNGLEIESAKLEVKSAKLSHRYKTPHSSLKIISLQLGAIGLGVITGFVALLNNDYVANIRLITLEDTFVLFALGLGIGNLKEIMERI